MIRVVVIVGFYHYLTTKSLTGRYFYAVGGNAKTAARVGSVNGDFGNSFEMDAIGACFIGGASAYGGSGSVIGAVIGGLLLGVINQGMSIIGLGNNWQYVVKGAILLFAVIFDVLSAKKLAKSQ